MNNENVKIEVFLKKDKGNLLGNAVISLNTFEFGWVTIKNFQIWRSNTFNERLQEPINIQPLSLKVYTHWVKQIFFESPDKWFELEMLIYSAFIAKRSEPVIEEVDIDDIPDNL